MNAARYIREHVLALSQSELAKRLGVSQPTIWRWEQAGMFPSEYQQAIREMGMQARPDWSDSWFFEPPPSQAAA